MKHWEKISLAFVIIFALMIAGWQAFRLVNRNLEIVSDSQIDAPEIVEQSDAQQIGTSSLPFSFPGGFELSVFAKDLPGVRVLLFDPLGRLLVSQTSQGKVIALLDFDKDNKAEEAKLLADKLDKPHGLALKCDPSNNRCQLFVAEENQVSVFAYDTEGIAIAEKKKIADLPSGAGHFTRSLLIAEVEGVERLLVSIGSSCNVCNERDSRRASILSMNLDGSDQQKFATGLRNTVFMALRPETDEIWGTDMGRDLLGDTLPPEEINVLTKNSDYGWPICYGDNIHDGKFDTKQYIKNPCTEPDYKPSRIDLPAHTAPLGLAFFPSAGWPADYQGDLLVAMHGSWNSSVPVGYKVVRIKLDQSGQAEKIEDFMTGWLTNEQEKIGRPVALVIQPNGTIYISDDGTGTVYRLKSGGQ